MSARQPRVRCFSSLQSGVQMLNINKKSQYSAKLAALSCCYLLKWPVCPVPFGGRVKTFVAAGLSSDPQTLG